jgi:wyosine [tRNA(Phe)-imidazoG37] synthetase (radical SAM superfamily)
VIVYGPVPSRRLGRSLGINNIPPKYCSYSCVYCQVGRTRRCSADREVFYTPKQIAETVRSRLQELAREGEKVDYLSFVPDGEPTLDYYLGESIDALKPAGKPVAVITNASLLRRKEVRAELGKADLVSLKIDTADEVTWKTINRPHSGLDMDALLEGIRRFCHGYRGKILTETMIIRGMNDGIEKLKDTAAFIASLGTAAVYLSIPTRPPAEAGITGPDENELAAAYRIFSRYCGDVELLTGYEGSNFTAGDDPAADILSITAVHPMRKDAVERLLSRTSSPWQIVRQLLEKGLLKKVTYNGSEYFIRAL